MRAVQRPAGSAPTCLGALDKDGRSERDRARAHQNDPTPDKGSFAYQAYRHEQVKRKLAQLFHNKCAYCETFYSASAPMDVEHYRPKAAVSEADGHSGYWWLAMSWDNLLPSCIDCNRRRKQHVVDPSTSLEDLYDQGRTHLALHDAGKKDSFPLKDNDRRLLAESDQYADEDALLLDPTRDDPRLHLRFHIDRDSPIGLVLPGGDPQQPSERGAVSIQTYGLNRLGLVQDRTRLLRSLEFLGDLVVELGEIIADLDQQAPQPAGAPLDRIGRRLRLMQERILLEMRGMAAPEAPYSEMVRAWLRQFTDDL
ncbi:HNH endonuclease [Pseudomonas sp. zfem002]|uniref:HNH endonuclease n=1 Tax=Pseudomonas sp. zfem002 TaxID=3078197 RepID=UPI002928976F|nr:HNH endonuclease [Pseudomonas sp. zfem002]MDU9389045.1 HNH endonuclease [Pseudomonas sp. zfem002]